MASLDTASLLVGLLLLFHTWGAWADLEVNMEGKVEVCLGETAQITCLVTSTEGVGGRSLEWLYVTRSGEKQSIYFQDSMHSSADQNTIFTNRISVNSTGANDGVVLTISPVTLEDEVEFICLVKTFTGEAGEGRTKLRVFQPPNLPTIERTTASGISVIEENPSKIGTCEVKNGYPKPNITWYRDSSPLRNTPGEVKVASSTTSESSGLFSVKSELYMKVVKEDKDAEFYCEVTYFVPGATKMTESSRINVNVYYPHTAVDIWIESPKGKIKEGDLVELRCDGNGNFPSTIFSIKRNQSDESREGNSVLLRNVTRLDSGEYECTAMDMETYDNIENKTKVFVNYLDHAVVTPESSTVVAQGGELDAACNALSSLTTSTTWFKNGAEVSKGHILRLRNATFDTAGTYVCVVTVPEIEEMETTGTLNVNVQGPPEIMAQKVTVIESSEKTVDLTCNVRGYPVPSVTWTPAEQVSILSEAETEEGFRSVVRVHFTSDVTVFCNAINENGTNSVAFNITVIQPMKHTTTPATSTTTKTTTTTTTANTTTTTTTMSNDTATTKSPGTNKEQRKEGNGVIIVVIIICLLLLAVLGSVLFFLYKKGKICGRSGKKDLSKVKSNKDNIVVEMKSDNTEEAILLGVNGEKQLPNDQSSEFLHKQK